MEVFAFSHQFIEGSLLFKSAVLHNENAVISAHQFLIKRVRDDYSGNILKIKNIGRDVISRQGIQRRCYLVSQKDR